MLLLSNDYNCHENLLNKILNNGYYQVRNKKYSLAKTIESINNFPMSTTVLLLPFISMHFQYLPTLTYQSR
jgi:hypothetical protein